jgi:Flp pilus assembly protein TadG
MKNYAKSIVSSTIKKLKSFHRNETGNIAMLMGMSALPLFMAAGAAIDMVRITREQASFNAAVDSAVLAIAADDRSSLAGQSPAQQAASIAVLEAYAQKYLTENYTPQTGENNPITLQLKITGQAIDITAQHDFPTTIMKLAGIEKVTLNSVSQVKKAMRPIEIVLVMDTTGSMAGSIDDAQKAAKDLLKALYGNKTLAQAPNSEYIRVALVPFSAAVRLDTDAHDFNLNWIDTGSDADPDGQNPLSRLNFTSPDWNNYRAWGQMINLNSNQPLEWNGCVEARNSTLAVSDTPPTNGDTLFPAYFNPDSPSTSGTWDNKYIANYVPAQIPVYALNPDGSIKYKNGKPVISHYIDDPAPTPIYGYENSGLPADIGTGSSSWGPRLKNQNKYVGYKIKPETITATDGPWKNCTKSVIVPMTHNRADVEAGIDAMVASGNTNVAEGLAWGMRVISPGEPFTKANGSGSIPADAIAPYNGPRWQKIVVLMTDGANNAGVGGNSWGGNSYGAYAYGNTTPLSNNRFNTTSSSAWEPKMDTNLSAICETLKASDKSVTIYATGFNLGNTGGDLAIKNRLKACATTGPEYYADSTNATALQAFFNHIGEDVLNKMIYVSK